MKSSGASWVLGRCARAWPGHAPQGAALCVPPVASAGCGEAGGTTTASVSSGSGGVTGTSSGERRCNWARARLRRLGAAWLGWLRRPARLAPAAPAARRGWLRRLRRGWLRRRCRRRLASGGAAGSGGAGGSARRGAPGGSGGDTVSVQIIAFNGFHGNLEAPTGGS